MVRPYLSENRKRINEAFISMHMHQRIMADQEVSVLALRESSFSASAPEGKRARAAVMCSMP